MLSLKEVIRPTTFIVSSKLRDRLGLDITIATESFQHTGSFKFRAAYNLAANVENNALLTASSGNFGQALAYACRLMGKKCTVVMPQTSAQVKIDAVRGFGATVDLIDTTKVARKKRVSQLAEQIPDAYLASAYDDKLVIEGNATLGDELSGNGFDTIIVPVGGGGLIAGIVQGLCRNGDSATVFGAEPLLGNDAARSFRSSDLIPNESEPETIADGARTVSIGDLNWPIIRDGVKGFIEVPETAISEAVRHYFELANLKSEPTGALSLGALLIDPQRFVGKRVCVIVSGGNVDTELYTKIIDRSANASFVK
ncbi:MAG TPA: pyridoxal-5'-phosphate-dependent protein [Blastocatellia bacterium]|nr:pyridoxal-5'-phosphate-dependent protein [Blastocatellia bacterium]